MPRYNFDPDPKRVVICDLETQSAANLREVGGKAYLADGTTRLLSAVFLIDGTVTVWVPAGRAPDDWWAGDLWPDGFDRERYQESLWRGSEVPDPVQHAIADGRTFIAHNAAGFDALAWERLVGGPQPEWCDTLPMVRAAGMPAGLDRLGHVFLGRGKDAGKDALKLLYTAKMRGGEVIYPVGTIHVWRDMLRYNVADVLLLEKVWDEVQDFGELDVMQVDATINQRGILHDAQLLARLAELWAQLQGDAADRVEELTEGDLGHANIRSVPQVRAWLARQGLNVKTLNRKELERLYADPEAYFGDVPDECDLSRMVEVLKSRQTATRISKGKIDRLRAMAAAEPDGRIRDVLVYWGAHTGRWSGRGFQPHNLAKGAVDLDVEACMAGPLTLESLRDHAARCKGSPSLDDVLSTLLRPVFRAEPGGSLLIVDYASVEARGVAWVAGQADLLEQFRRGEDTYCRMASEVFGRKVTKEDKTERHIGKTLVLGAGYGIGANKFAMYCQLSGIDLAAAGTSAEACVEAYRDAFPRIAGRKAPGSPWRRGGVWKEYETAARTAVEMFGRKSALAGRCEFIFDAGSLRVYLPSGRWLTYRDARIEPRVPGYAAVLGLEAKPRPTLVYTHGHGYEGHLYGGLLCENIVQAICRDLLATAMVRCEEEGIPVVLHVHDEIVAECPPGMDPGAMLHKLARVMSEPPPWADGFPVAVEGFSCERYSKTPFSTSLKVEAKGGVIDG